MGEKPYLAGSGNHFQRGTYKGSHSTKDWMSKIDNVDAVTTERRYDDFKDPDHASESQKAEEEIRLHEEMTANSFNGEQVAELTRIDLNWLAAIAAPMMFIFKYPKVLLAAWQLLTQAAVKNRDFTQIALGIPRGHGKTTLVKLFILWCIFFSKKQFILVIASTATLADNIIADVVTMLNEKNILTVFGNWRVAIETDRSDLKKFSFRGRTITLASVGCGGSMRGINLNNARPDVMIFEDIQTKEDSESKEVSDKIETWMIGTAMKAKSPHGCLFIFCANMYPGPNSILKKLKRVRTWTKFIAGGILSNGEALWEELRSKEELLAEFDNDIEMGHPEIFFSEVLNDTEAGINTRTDLSRISAWPFEEFEHPQGKFIMIDPSTGKATSDNVSIGFFEVYDGIPALRKIIEEQLSPGATIRAALLMAIDNNCKVIACEGTGYQSTLLYWFNQICEQLSIHGFHFIEVYNTTQSKNSRIAKMLQSLTAKPTELHVHPEVRGHVEAQITNWNPLKRDNMDNTLDLLTYAPKVVELAGPLLSTEMDPEIIEASDARVQHQNTSF